MSRLVWTASSEAATPDVLAASGWTDRAPKAKDVAKYRRGFDRQQPWWHLKTARFARSYGRKNPGEDWATAWEAYFARRFGLNRNAFAKDSLTVLRPNKQRILDRFFA